MTVNELTERLRRALSKNPAGAGSLKFALRGEGFIRAEGDLVDNEDAPADCTLVISKSDLDAVLDGSLDAQTALMDGRLELLGDVAVATAMQPAIIAAWTLSQA